MSKCPPKSFKYLSSQANAKDKLLEDGAINQTSVIIDLNKFKEKAEKFLNYVKKEFNIDATSVISGRLGETVNYNREVFSKVDKIRGYDKINAEEIRKQLAELEEKPAISEKVTTTDALKTFDFGSKEGTPQTKATDKAIHNNVINNPDKPMYDEGESFNEAFNRVIPEVSKLVDTVPANTVM